MLFGVDVMVVLIISGVASLGFIAGGLTVWLAVRKVVNDSRKYNHLFSRSV